MSTVPNMFGAWQRWRGVHWFAMTETLVKTVGHLRRACCILGWFLQDQSSRSSIPCIPTSYSCGCIMDSAPDIMEAGNVMSTSHWYPDSVSRSAEIVGTSWRVYSNMEWLQKLSPCNLLSGLIGVWLARIPNTPQVGHPYYWSNAALSSMCGPRCCCPMDPGGKAWHEICGP